MRKKINLSASPLFDKAAKMKKVKPDSSAAYFEKNGKLKHLEPPTPSTATTYVGTAFRRRFRAISTSSSTTDDDRDVNTLRGSRNVNDSGLFDQHLDSDSVTDPAKSAKSYNIEWEIPHNKISLTSIADVRPIKRFNRQSSRTIDFNNVKNDYFTDPLNAWFPVLASVPMMLVGTVVTVAHAIMLPLMIYTVVNTHVQNVKNAENSHEGGDMGCLENEHKHTDYPCHSNEWYATPISHYLLDSESTHPHNVELAQMGFPIVGLMTGIVMCIRFWPVKRQSSDFEHITVVPANVVGFIVGMIIAMSMFMPGMFHMSYNACVEGAFTLRCMNGVLHNLGAGLSFGFGMIFGWLHSVDIYRQTHWGPQRPWAQVRLAECSFVYMSWCMLLAVIGLGIGFWQEIGVLDPDPKTNFLPIIAVCEWLMMIFIFYFVLFMYPWMWMDYFWKRDQDQIEMMRPPGMEMVRHLTRRTTSTGTASTGIFCSKPDL